MPKNNLDKLKDNIGLSQRLGIEIEKNEDKQLFKNIQEQQIKILKDIRASKDLKQILEAERIFIATELVKSKEQERSIAKAMQEFDSGQKSLLLVEDKEGYKKANQTYSAKTRDDQNLPKDSFRQFIDSHNTRLKNKLTNPESSLEAQFLKERQQNLKTATEIYKEKQKEALTVNPLIEDIKKLSAEELIKKYPERSREIAFIKNSEEHLKRNLEEPLRSMAIKGVRENVATRLDAGEKMPQVQIAQKTQVKEQSREADHARD